MKNQTRHSALLLTEIIIAILFFSLISAVCMQIFVKSHTLSQDTKDLDFSVQQTSSVAALLKSSSDASALLTQYYPLMETTDDGEYIFYDKTYAPCSKEDAVYTLAITSDMGEDLHSFHLEVCTQDDVVIYQVDITTYQPTGDA